MKQIVKSLVLLAPIALMGCSYLSKPSFMEGREKTYLSAKSIPPLRVPPGVASSAFHSAYPVSDRQYSTSAEDVSLLPPGLK